MYLYVCALGRIVDVRVGAGRGSVSQELHLYKLVHVT